MKALKIQAEKTIADALKPHLFKKVTPNLIKTLQRELGHVVEKAVENLVEKPEPCV